MVWGEGDDQLWGSGRGAIGAIVVRYPTLEEYVVPLQGAIVVCYGSGG